MKRTAFFLTCLVLILLVLGRIKPEQTPSLPNAPSLETQQAIQETLSQLPLYFIENQGQLDEQVAYYLQGPDKTVYFTATGVTIAQTAPAKAPTRDERLMAHEPGQRMAGADHYEAQRWSVKLEFVGANPNVQPIGEEKTEAIISYFKGQPEEWHTGLSTYSRVVYPNLWPGIDLVYEGSASQLKYTFIVQPGADPTQIRLAYRGATDVTLNSVGQMEVTTPIGGFTDDIPVAYQETDGQRQLVEIGYVLDTTTASDAWRSSTSKPVTDAETYTFRFQVGSYDADLPLILDPVVLLYSGYIGGLGSDMGYGIAVDALGNAYVTGTTYSTEATFPVLVGPDLTFNGFGDVFVAKINTNGSALVYAGYIGGASYDDGYGIAVDALGNAYVTGSTSSPEDTFPVLVGPDLTFNSDDIEDDVFVAKINSSGSALVYAGYIGGASYDEGYGIAVDGSGNAFVTGGAGSPEDTFPVVVGPDLTFNGNYDAFVAKVNSSGSALVYAGYIGGLSGDYGRGIAVDEFGNAYVTGGANSSEDTFPVLIGPDLTHNGNYDAYVAKVSSSGSALVYAGYIGGLSSEYGSGIAVDESGNAYVTGSTYSNEATFPVLVGPDLTYNGSWDAYVAKVNSSGSALVYAGYIGGAGEDWGDSIAVDGLGNAYVTGATYSTEATLPVLVGPDLTHNGDFDAYVAKVNISGSALIYAGYIGGAGPDSGYSITVDRLGSAYVAGYTYSTEATFPVLIGPDLTHNGGTDTFIAKVVLDVVPPTSSASSPTFVTAGPISVTWSAGDDISGVSSTALWVKYGSSGMWVDSGLAQPGTSSTFAYVPANGDGIYYFATVATDYAGNVENTPVASGDDSTIYDTTIPESNASVPTYATVAPISVTWNASDATSGVSSTALWVKFDASGVWVDTGFSQPGTSGTFTYSPVNGDGIYYFATVATDNAGHVEAAPAGSGDDSLIYDTVAPNSIAFSPGNVTTSSIPVTWSASDGLSGLSTTALWVKFGSSGIWVDSGLAQPGTSGVFYYVAGNGPGTYYFATVATDHAGLVEATPVGVGDTTTLYEPLYTVFLPLVLNNDLTHFAEPEE